MNQKRELFDGLIRIHVLLHGLERAGLLKAVHQDAGERRKMYRITAAGRKALDRAREKVDELHRELHEAHPRKLGKLAG